MLLPEQIWVLYMSAEFGAGRRCARDLCPGPDRAANANLAAPIPSIVPWLYFWVAATPNGSCTSRMDPPSSLRPSTRIVFLCAGLENCTGLNSVAVAPIYLCQIEALHDTPRLARTSEASAWPLLDARTPCLSATQLGRLCGQWTASGPSTNRHHKLDMEVCIWDPPKRWGSLKNKQTQRRTK